MKLSTIVLSTLLALSLNNVANAADHTGTKNAIKDCPLQTVTSAYITYKTSAKHTADIGKLYESYTDKVKGLSTTGHFNNFKLVSQNFRTGPAYTRPTEENEVNIDFTVEFDLDYKAITDLASIKATDLTVNTFERKICQ